MNDLWRRAAKCEGLAPCEIVGGSMTQHYSEPLTNYDDWNNVMRLRDLAIAKDKSGFSKNLIKLVAWWDWDWETVALVVARATKEQIVEACCLTMEEESK